MVGKKTKKLTVWGKIWRIAVAIIIPLAVGGVSAALTMDAMKKFGDFNQPPLSPPALAFPIAWTILYVLMGVASYLIVMAIRTNKGKRSSESVKKVKTGKAALVLYGVQLVFNFLWSIFFFKLELRWFALGWIIVMWAMILALTILAHRLNKGAFWCLLPYLLWVTFATYLNAGVAALN